MDVTHGRIDPMRRRMDPMRRRMDPMRRRMDVTHGRLDVTHGRVDPTHGRVDVTRATRHRTPEAPMDTTAAGARPETQQLPLGLEGGRRIESRAEPREATVRRVEYTSFPRVGAGAETLTRVGFTRDVSASGMALGVEEVLPVGTLLRAIVQKADGRPDFDAVARVAWCREAGEASPGGPRAWIGLVLVAEVRRGLARVPRTSAAPVRAGLRRSA